METGITTRPILKLLALLPLYYLLFSTVSVFLYTAPLTTLALLLILGPLFFIGYRRKNRNPASTTPICNVTPWDSDSLTEIPLDKPLTRAPLDGGEPALKEDT